MRTPAGKIRSCGYRTRRRGELRKYHEHDFRGDTGIAEMIRIKWKVPTELRLCGGFYIVRCCTLFTAVRFVCTIVLQFH